MDAHVRRELALQGAARAELVRVKCNMPRTGAVDPFLLAEKRGCEVRFMSLPSLEGVYSPTPRPVIILGSQRPAGRRAFTCAHELGHHEFKHGTRLDELNAGRFQKDADPDEYLADMFAAFLLMSQASLRRAFKDRALEPSTIEPMQVFQLACHFGVGYSTLIDQMTWTLKMLPAEKCEKLLRIQPKEFKSYFGGSPQSEVFLVDEFWKDRTVDLEIGDILVFHKGALLEDSHRLLHHGTVDGRQAFKAISKGYARAFHKNTDWGLNIRIASKHYAGLAQHRFFDDPEEEVR